MGEQANLERERLREEHQQCVQIDLNRQKLKALKVFVEAIQEVPQGATKVLDSFKAYIKISEQDRFHKYVSSFVCLNTD